MSAKLTKIEQTIKRFQRVQAKLAKNRDELREVYDNAEQLLNDIDIAEGDFEEALGLIQGGLDGISQSI